MNKKNWSTNFFGDGLRLISHCPICNTKHNILKAKILEEKNNSHLIHVTCDKCKSSVIALILSNALGISSIGLVTDLDSEEVLKFKEGSDISCDEIIEFHQKLEKGENFIKDLMY